MNHALYLRVHSDRFNHYEIESMLNAFVREVHWIDERNLKAELDDFGRVQLKLMFASFQHDLGIILTGVLGFDADEIMNAFLDFVSENRPGKLIGASEALLLAQILKQNGLMIMLDRHFGKINRDEMETARMYLETGRNVNASAQHLYLHRNTFRYRLNKFIAKTRLDIREIDQGKLMETWFLLKEMD
ncbi:MAG: PucR family transcriptional regulator [Erysipelotrichales bacterium]|nr:MAG: PucR family transcriptional regulator [Erysipelotrichales bacterium]